MPAAVMEKSKQDPAVAIAERLAEHREAARKRRDEHDDAVLERARLRRERVDLVLDAVASGVGRRATERVDARVAELDRLIAGLEPAIAEDERLEAGLAERERDAIDAARQAEGRRRTEAFMPLRRRTLHALRDFEAAMDAEAEFFDAAKTAQIPLGADSLPAWGRLRTLIREVTNRLMEERRTDLAGVELRTRRELGRIGDGWAIVPERR